jgi:hypothetical protein
VFGWLLLMSFIGGGYLCTLPLSATRSAAAVSETLFSFFISNPMSLLSG